MSAADDRMVVRTAGGYRSLPRRVALGLISAGRAKADRGPLAGAQDVEAPTVPATPERPSTVQEHPVTPSQIVDAATHGTLPDVVDVASPEYSAALEYLADGSDASDLFEEDVPTVEAVELPEPPRGNAGRKDWADYAQEHLGIEVTSDMTRNQIRDAAQERLQSLARLPQPALPGGRLDTPEDEPATVRTVADDEDPGTR